MTLKQLNEWEPLIAAFKRGKLEQWRPSLGWVKAESINFFLTPGEHRVAPEGVRIWALMGSCNDYVQEFYYSPQNIPTAVPKENVKELVEITPIAKEKLRNLISWLAFNTAGSTNDGTIINQQVAYQVAKDLQALLVPYPTSK